MSIVIYISGGFFFFPPFPWTLMIIDRVLCVPDVTTGDLQVLKYAFVWRLIFLSCTFPELVLEHRVKASYGASPAACYTNPNRSWQKEAIDVARSYLAYIISPSLAWPRTHTHNAACHVFVFWCVFHRLHFLKTVCSLIQLGSFQPLHNVQPRTPWSEPHTSLECQRAANNASARSHFLLWPRTKKKKGKIHLILMVNEGPFWWMDRFGAFRVIRLSQCQRTPAVALMFAQSINVALLAARERSNPTAPFLHVVMSERSNGVHALWISSICIMNTFYMAWDQMRHDDNNRRSQKPF